MNEKLNKFIVSMGALAELWRIVYQNFTSAGYDEKSALTHTQAFMQVVMNTIAAMGENDKTKQEE